MSSLGGGASSWSGKGGGRWEMGMNSVAMTFSLPSLLLGTNSFEFGLSVAGDDMLRPPELAP